MDRKACWYSVIRYSSDEISGEVINVGLILHTIQSNCITKFYILDGNSPKVRSILYTKADEMIYKSFKDIFEYYLTESVDNITGAVGDISIASANNEKFLQSLYEYFQNKKMNISEPTFSLTVDEDGLFKSLFNSYVGQKHYPTVNGKERTIKNVIKKMFEDKNFLNTKVKQDIKLNPLPELPIKISVDFGFKNGVWNYLQTTPDITNVAKGTEWFAKTKFLIDNIEQEKVYLLYRKSVIHEKTETLNLINYFGETSEKVVGLDMDDLDSVNKLFNKIEKEAHPLELVC